MPIVTINQTYVEVYEGQNFTLICNATGSPSPL